MKFLLFSLLFINLSALILSDQSDEECRLILDNEVSRNGTLDDVNNAFENLRPVPRKSLVIVFDTTGSMSTDLESLRDAAISIVKKFQVDHANNVENYILAEFNDPVVPPVFITTDVDLFIDRLNEIIVDGGGDCPELALQGLLGGIAAANKNSVAYVFTDASAKDYMLKDDVISSVQEKQITVDFLVTGNCGDSSVTGNVFKDISDASGGQVFQIKRREIEQVLVALSNTLDARFSSLFATSFDSYEESRTIINVDSTFISLTVSVAGESSSLSVKNSKSEAVVPTEVLSLTNVQVMTFDVDDTNYEIRASASSRFSLRVGGIANLKFDFGFSADLPNVMGETSTQPLIDSPNYLSIFPSDIELVKCITKVIILPAVDGAFESFELLTIKFGDTFMTQAVDFPTQLFKIRILGWDVNGIQIDRVISAGVASIDASPPSVVISHTFSPSSFVSRDSEFYIGCIYQSLIAVRAIWYFNGVMINETSTRQSSIFVMRIDNFNDTSVGVYECVVINELGEVTAREKIEIAPVIETNPKVLNSFSGERHILSCAVVDGRSGYSITWKSFDGSILKSTSGLHESSLIDTLEFEANLSFHNQKIFCEYKDEDFKTQEFIELIVEDIPTERPVVVPDGDVVFNIGDPFILVCSCENCLPIRKVEWMGNRSGILTNFPDRFITNEADQVANTFNSTLDLGEAKKSFRGIYWCTFENALGTDKREIDVNVV